MIELSFAKGIKDELTSLKVESICCKKAELSAFLELNTGIIFNSEGIHLEFKSTNPAISRKFISLIKEFYDVNVSILNKEQKLTRNNLYIAIIENAKTIIDDYSLLNIDNILREEKIKNTCCKGAYLRGAFLCMGSINNPENSYHMEIKAKDESDAVYIQRILNYYDLNSKITKRRNELIVYLKDVNKILDFINIIGSTRVFFEYHNIMVKKDFNNRFNRKLNFELANETKAASAGLAQLEDIKIIEENVFIDKIDEKIMQVIKLRKENPVLSNKEMIELFEKEYKVKITKSGLYHRFKKIHDMAQAIKERMSENK